ncbi:MAG TPA: glycosyltransferase 87 family protein [Candidatus Polarisedimenticolia bacterium]|nr:glycosyltransferase 87 family protein [Candidatus Polarisedimenticolia bacterium]
MMRGSMKALHRRRYIAASLLWCLAALAIKPFYPYLDFGVFYSTAIEKILAGHPLDIYSFIARAPGNDLPLPLCHSPLYFFFLAPWYALGRLMGISDFQNSAGISLGQAWMLLVTLPFDLLLCREALRWVEKLHGKLPEPRRIILYLCLLYSPLLWLSSVRFGHNEALVVLLVLLALRQGEEDRPVRSGILWGLALSLKATAAVPALTYLGWEGTQSGRRRSMLVCGAMAGMALFLPLLPYLLFRREQTWYALVGFEGLRRVGGYALWKVATFPVSLIRASGALILAGSALVGAVLGRRRAPRFFEAGGAHALVLGQVLLLLLGKALFIWYGLALSVFVYLAFADGKGERGSLPIGAFLTSVLLWLLQAGPWIGEEVNSWIRLRSTLWVLLLLAIGLAAVVGLRASEVPGRGPDAARSY